MLLRRNVDGEASFKPLYRYMSERRTLNWIDALPRVIEAMNNSPNRATHMRPCEVGFHNASEVWQKLYGNVHTRQQQRRRRGIQVGDSVRVAKEHKIFQKGYIPKFSPLTYTVSQVKPTTPKTFRLRDPLTKRRLEKKWYGEELSKATHGSKRIERVLRTRTVGKNREYLIKWEGEPLATVSWVKERDL